MSGLELRDIRMLITDFDMQKTYILLYIQVQTVKRKRSKIGSAVELPVKHGNHIKGIDWQT